MTKQTSYDEAGVIKRESYFNEAGDVYKSVGYENGDLGTGDFAHFRVEEVGVPATDEVGRCAYLHFFGRGFIRNDEAGFTVLEVDVIGQVVDERAEEVAVFHGVQVCHLAARDIHPHTYQSGGLLVGAVFQQPVDAHPAPAAVALVKQSHLHAQGGGGVCGAAYVAFHRSSEEAHVFRMDGFFRFGEDVGSPVFHGHAHHFHALLRVENFIVFKHPAEHAFLCGAQGLAHHVPHKDTGDGPLGIILLGRVTHLPYNIPFPVCNFKQNRCKISRKFNSRGPATTARLQVPVKSVKSVSRSRFSGWIYRVLLPTVGNFPGCMR